MQAHHNICHMTSAEHKDRHTIMQLLTRVAYCHGIAHPAMRKLRMAVRDEMWSSLTRSQGIAATGLGEAAKARQKRWDKG